MSPASSGVAPAGLRRCLVVLGTHRSGTSAVAGCLHAAGVAFGSPLLMPAADNPKGYFEHLRLVDLNDGFLERHGSHWADPQPAAVEFGPAERRRMVIEAADLLTAISGDHAVFALKDPRMLRFLPVWEEALHAAGFEPRWILVVRHPRSIQRSLIHRDWLAEPHTLALWYRDMRAALSFLPGRDHVLVRYESLVRDPGSALTPLTSSGWLGADEATARALRGFIDPNLDHSRAVDDNETLGDPDADALWRLTIDALREGRVRAQALPRPHLDETDPARCEWLAPVKVQLYFGVSEPTLAESHSVSRSIAPCAAADLEFDLPEGDWTTVRFDPTDVRGAVALSLITLADASGTTVPLDHPGVLRLDSAGSLHCTVDDWAIVSYEDDCRLFVQLPPGFRPTRFRCTIAVVPLAIMPATVPSRMRLGDRGTFPPGRIPALERLLGLLGLQLAEAAVERARAEHELVAQRVIKLADLAAHAAAGFAAQETALRHVASMVSEAAERQTGALATQAARQLESLDTIASRLEQADARRGGMFASLSDRASANAEAVEGVSDRLRTAAAQISREIGELHQALASVLAERHESLSSLVAERAARTGERLESLAGAGAEHAALLREALGQAAQRHDEQFSALREALAVAEQQRAADAASAAEAREGLRAALPSLREALAQLQAELSRERGMHEATRAALRRADAAERAAHEHYRTSWSWRLTAPLRTLGDFLRRRGPAAR